MRTRGRVAFAAVAILLAAVAPHAEPAAGAPGQGGVLVVGDSLEVLTSPHLPRHLPGVPLTVNAEGGYNSNQIRELFEESYEPSHSVVVFDAGTNDNPAYPEILAANLRAVAARIGPRCMVVPTIQGLTVNGVGNEGKNRVVADFAAARPGTQVPDWRRLAVTRPDLMQADGLHPTAAGADRRARLIAAAVKRCLAATSAVPAARQPRLRSAPDLRPVGAFAARQAELVRSLTTALGAALLVGLAERSAPAAAVGLLAVLGGTGA